MTPPKTARVGEHFLVTGPRGRIFTTLLDASHVYFYFEGQVELAMFDETMAPANQALASGRAYLHGDGGNWKNYAAEYRTRWTDWFVQNRARIAHVDLMVRSPILRMGVQVVNLFTSGIITALDDDDALYERMRRECPTAEAAIATWPADVRARARRSSAETRR
ncbi:MAG: hypothetical protein U0234_06550 [Sandaracinus sp.]